MSKLNHGKAAHDLEQVGHPVDARRELASSFSETSSCKVMLDIATLANADNILESSDYQSSDEADLQTLTNEINQLPGLICE